MTDAIVSAYKRLVETVGAFNEKWPALVVGGMIWRIPLLSEQRTPSRINVQVLTGTDAIKAAVRWLVEQGFESASKTNIRSACTGKMKTAYGFRWQFAEGGV